MQCIQYWKNKNVPEKWEISNMFLQTQNMSTNKKRFYKVCRKAAFWLQSNSSEIIELFCNISWNLNFDFILQLKHL